MCFTGKCWIFLGLNFFLGSVVSVLLPLKNTFLDWYKYFMGRGLKIWFELVDVIIGVTKLPIEII